MSGNITDNDEPKNKFNRKRFLIKNLVTVLGPVVFEIVNTLTGEWTIQQGSFPISTGKLITILIAAIYLTLMVYFAYKDYEKKKIDKELSRKIMQMEKEKQFLLLSLGKSGNEIAYASHSIKSQMQYLRTTNDTTVRELNVVHFATTVCSDWYNLMCQMYGDKHITVNVYHKYKKNERKIYQKMIAHEGYITQPRYFGQERLLRDKKNNYYSEQILLSNNPEYKILLNPKEVAAAFQKEVANCKYKQYIAIPICDDNNNIIFLIEINVLDQIVIKEDEETFKSILNIYFSNFKEYMLMMINIEKYIQLFQNIIIERK